MTTLTVGSGQQYATISAAAAAAKPGDTVNVQAGTYTNDFPGQINGLTIQGVGGIAKLVATVAPPNGKAILDVAGDTTLRNLDISGATVPDANGAAIRYESGNLLIQNTAIHGNQDGILGAADPSGTITVDGSEIYNNGTSAGSTHNIYIGDVATFTLTNSYIHDANTGHEVKSRAETNIITNNRIEDGSSSASYQIDLPSGGNATISGNTIQKSANSGNHVTIAYGEEGNAHTGTTVSITNNTFVSDQPGAYVISDTTNAAVTASGNSVYNFSQIDKSGHVSSNGFTTIGSRPTLDTSSPIQSGGSSTQTPTPTPTPTPVADTTAPQLTVTESKSGLTNGATDTVSGTVSDNGSGVASGNASASVSAGATETILGATPTQPVTTQPVTTPIVPTIASASLAGSSAFQLDGTAQANSVVTLTDTAAGSTGTIGSVTTASDGTWHITASTINPQTINKFAVSATSDTSTTAGSASLTLSSTNSEVLVGTAGKADVFAFAANSGRDFISGFETSRDVIDLVGSTYHSFDQLQSKFTGSGSTIFSVSPTSAIAVVGVDPSALTAANFRFT